MTGKSATVKLPKAPKGSKLAVYVRTGNGKFAKAKGTPNKNGGSTIKGLKKNTKYEVKLVKVNKAGKQSTASKTLKVKTKKKSPLVNHALPLCASLPVADGPASQRGRPR